jgi:hypothetical protein
VTYYKDDMGALLIRGTSYCSLPGMVGGSLGMAPLATVMQASDWLMGRVARSRAAVECSVSVEDGDDVGKRPGDKRGEVVCQRVAEAVTVDAVEWTPGCGGKRTAMCGMAGFKGSQAPFSHASFARSLCPQTIF